MIGIWSSHSDIFLYIVGVVTLIFYGIPLVFAPMSWARVFRWELPQASNLVATLGRSLGMVISIMAIFAFVAARNPAAKPFYFGLTLSVFAGMFLVHVYGALRKTQPFTETLEIVLWVLLGVVTLGFYPR